MKSIGMKEVFIDDQGNYYIGEQRPEEKNEEPENGYDAVFRPSWFTWLSFIFFGIFLFLVGVLFYGQFGVAFILIGSSFMIFAYVIADRYSEKVTVSGWKLHHERGILRKDGTSLYITKELICHPSQSFLQRMFDIGTLTIESKGDEPETIIRNYADFAKLYLVVSGKGLE